MKHLRPQPFAYDSESELLSDKKWVPGAQGRTLTRACPTAVFFPERARKKWAWKPIFVLRGALLKTSIKNTSKTTCFGRSFPALTDCHVLLSEIGLQAAFCFSLSSAHSRPLNNHRLWPNTAHANANSRCSKPLLLRGRPRKSFFMIPIRPSVWLRRF